MKTSTPLTFVAALISSTIMTQTVVEAASPKNALGAIAVSPDQNQILAGGDNRVLYQLNADTLNVEKRVWIGINPLTMHFNAEGSSFFIHDTADVVTFYDAKTFAPTLKIKGVKSYTVAKAADLLIVSGKPKGRGTDATTPLAIYQLSNGEKILETTVNAPVQSLGSKTDGSKIYALSRPIKSDDEPKKRPTQKANGLERANFVQRNDGKVSLFLELDGQGNETNRMESFFSSSQLNDLITIKDTVYAVNYSNVNAKFDLQAGTTDLFQVGKGFNYAIGALESGSTIVTGTLSQGNIMQPATGNTVTFMTEKLEGWPEYFEGFVTTDDGTIYGGTSAYRLFKISPDGQVITNVPVY